MINGESAETLQDLVLRRLLELGNANGPMSAKAAADRSRGGVSYELLRLIARGKHGGGITDRVAEGISLALDVPVSVVYRAARKPRPDSRWEMPERFDRLSVAERRAVERVAGAILDAYDRGRGDSSDAGGVGVSG